MTFSRKIKWYALAVISTLPLLHCLGDENIRLSDLHCDYRVNPLGIDDTQPELSWVINADGDQRGVSQIAYQVIVASSQSLLNQDEGDLWNSGKVHSDASAQITYRGRELLSGQDCFWKVRIWDQSGTKSSWSEPAAWSMGLLQSQDWNGKWIGLDQGENTNPAPSELDGAQWIWFPEGDPVISAPVAARYFRRNFELPNSAIPKEGIITIMADDKFSLFLNGSKVGSGRGTKAPCHFDVGNLLRRGRNILAVQVNNLGDAPNPAGLVLRLNVPSRQEPSFTFDTGEGWKISTNSGSRWTKPGFNDRSWLPAKILGKYGIEPWGDYQKESDRRLPARYLRHEFTIDKQVQRATAYVCGEGLFELYLNGGKVSNDVLVPAVSEYDKRVFYLTFDVTDRLKQGDNAVGVILANGRYFAPRLKLPTKTRTFGYPKLLLQMNVIYTDGTTTQIISDENWKLTTNGPICANNEYDGEQYDARLDMPGWCSPHFDDSAWQQAQLVQPAAPQLSAQIGDPIRVMQTLHPVSVTKTSSGTFIFDMGQNMVGWCQLKISGPRGTTVTIRHAERLLPDGELYTANLRSAEQTDNYTLKGDGLEIYEPRFTYHGFRYVELAGFPGKPSLDTIEGKVVYDALPKSGDFACSDKLLNQIYHNIYWGTRGNYHGVPTDCPQRDERQGWLGDRSAESEGETYLFDIAPLYSQWLEDMQDSQRTNGSVAEVAPAYWPFYNDGVVWPSSYIIIPHMLYEQYGDINIFRKHYASMKQWVDHMTNFIEGDIMPTNKYGDWCIPPESLTEVHSSDTNMQTSGPLMSTAYFYYDLTLMACSARSMGKMEDAMRYELLAGQMKTAFNSHFYNPDAGYYSNGTQTSCVLPLAFGLVPDHEKSRVFAHLVDKITESRNHSETGLVGGQYLMRVLSDNGRPDLAYSIATQTTYPSWGYMVSEGATTMWELWNGNTAAPGMNSGNHVMLVGDLNIWLNEYLGGIRTDLDASGFKRIIIEPEIVGDLTWVKASYNSIHGLISSNWNLNGGKFHLEIMIPANCTATVYVPAKTLAEVTEGSRAVAQAEGVTFLKMENGYAVFQVGSGHYNFQS